MGLAIIKRERGMDIFVTTTGDPIVGSTPMTIKITWPGFAINDPVTRTGLRNELRIWWHDILNQPVIVRFEDEPVDANPLRIAQTSQRRRGRKRHNVTGTSRNVSSGVATG